MTYYNVPTKLTASDRETIVGWTKLSFHWRERPQLLSWQGKIYRLRGYFEGACRYPATFLEYSEEPVHEIEAVPEFVP